MGESACLMHAFSYASGIPNEAKQENPIHALGESVSFGRFMSESLAWEKWSTFSHKRYVEEAESYAQPGSVAQKKAFFEAYYKSIAAKKAAALLEQANAATTTSEPESKGVVEEQQKVKTKVDFVINNDGGNSDGKPAEADVGKVGEADPVKGYEVVVEKPAATNESLNQLGNVEVEAGKVRAADATAEHEATMENPKIDESLNQLDNVEDQKTVSEELAGTPIMQKPLLRQSSNCNTDLLSSMTKKKPILSSLKSSVRSRSTKVPYSPAKSIHSTNPKKENNVTPFTGKHTMDSRDQKRSTPKKSLRSLFTPTEEPKKLSSSAIRKTESSKVAPVSCKASKDFTNPPRTPPMVTVNGMSKHSSTTPCSENKRANTPLHPAASGSKTTGPKWHILPAACSKSLSACRNKLQSPTLFTPFMLRTEERAARRKQKLEEKFNAREAQKLQMQATIMEKAETELRKLRPRFCFKARPLPDFYKEKDTSKNQIKKLLLQDPVMHYPQSPKTVLKANVSTRQSTKTSSTKKNNASQNALKKNTRTLKSLAAIPEKVSHENTSPNIQPKQQAVLH